MSWHDSACYRTKQFVCEDSDKMVVTMIMVTMKMMIDGGGDVDDADFEAVRFHGLR